MISFFKKTKISKKDKEWFKPEGELAIDVFETDSEIIVQSTIAGIKTEELDIFIENNMLTIKGDRKRPKMQDSKTEKNYLYQECYWGPFSRQAILPEEVNNIEAEAAMNDGILTITIPKTQNEKKKKITIKEKE
ncbi:Hsp20/alpha crystallin family protein [Candidatus Parcubacteria bacterium]|nr:Hsp20/alpha crystallin family protein [Candidatus Parcubacteria bacterium]